ncbi:MAG: manganese efflux pump MntP family protein [Prevotellaceae bacterium]|jgi:putative Mn2+ efflux pump MntP|nr:manganese efflux pump MntP family protein [Prevotellaceae bacterium]
MSGIELWLLAIGLAMDCFAVSIASGIILKRVEWRPMLIMAFSFGLFQAAMPLIGWMGAGMFSYLIQEFDHWIAFAILAFLGFRMIKESFKNEEQKHDYNPRNLKVVLALAVATSIDALAIGISFAFLGMDTYGEIASSVLIIGAVSFLFSMVGLMLGARCHHGIARRLRVELLGGIILILIGTKIVIEHLFLEG